MEKLPLCQLWNKPELVNGGKHFELVETYVDTKHLLRRLLRCFECGQLYFFLFYKHNTMFKEEDGSDYQYSTCIPVALDDKRSLKNKPPLEVLMDPVYIPRIQEDLMPHGGRNLVYWVR